MLNCPWNNFRQDTLRFCEADLCGFVRFPADSYSMVALLLVAIFLIKRNKRSPIHLQAIGYIGLFLAVGSFLYHATGTWFGQILDVTGMLFFSSYYLCLIAWRFYGWSRCKLIRLFVINSVLSFGAMLVEHRLGLVIFTSQLVVAFLGELGLYRRDRGAVDYKGYIVAISCFAFGFLAWFLDLSGLVCNPNNHILTGHGVWHIANAGAFYYTAAFASQFNFDSTSNP